MPSGLSPPFIFPFLLELQTKKKKKKSFLSISNGAVVSGKGLLCALRMVADQMVDCTNFSPIVGRGNENNIFMFEVKKISSFRYFYCIMHHIPPDVRALKKKKFCFASTVQLLWKGQRGFY